MRRRMRTSTSMTTATTSPGPSKRQRPHCSPKSWMLPRATGTSASSATCITIQPRTSCTASKHDPNLSRTSARPPPSRKTNSAGFSIQPGANCSLRAASAPYRFSTRPSTPVGMPWRSELTLKPPAFSTWIQRANLPCAPSTGSWPRPGTETPSCTTSSPTRITISTALQNQQIESPARSMITPSPCTHSLTDGSPVAK